MQILESNILLASDSTLVHDVSFTGGVVDPKPFPNPYAKVTTQIQFTTGAM